MLSLVDVRKEYGEGDGAVVALRSVSLSFRENEFVSILGPSGCGKTTLLNIIGGLDHYTSGDLVIRGGSLGVIQAIAAAALDPQVTLAIVSVPAFCEFAGELSGRKRSIPARNVKGELTPEMVNALGYFDAVNFTPLIKCEIVFCTGFTDELCPPSNVFAVFNALPEATKAKSQMFFNPAAGHYGQINASANPRVKKLLDSVVIKPYDVKN